MNWGRFYNMDQKSSGPQPGAFGASSRREAGFDLDGPSSPICPQCVHHGQADRSRHSSRSFNDEFLARLRDAPSRERVGTSTCSTSTRNTEPDSWRTCRLVLFFLSRTAGPYDGREPAVRTVRGLPGGGREAHVPCFHGGVLAAARPEVERERELHVEPLRRQLRPGLLA